jgi:hypothetical protein
MAIDRLNVSGRLEEKSVAEDLNGYLDAFLDEPPHMITLDDPLLRLQVSQARSLKRIADALEAQLQQQVP